MTDLDTSTANDSAKDSVDKLTRYLFPELAVRCVAVRLSDSWQASQAHIEQSNTIASLLGETVAANVLMAANLKAGSRLNVQVQSPAGSAGTSAIELLLSQCRDSLEFRGICNLKQADIKQTELLTALSQSQASVLYEPDSGTDRYQGIVPASAEGIASSLEAYFAQSEQLPTRLWLAADSYTASGLMLQMMPGANETSDGDGWNRLQQLAETIKPEELLQLPSDDIMHRLFHQETVNKLDERQPQFRCGCSAERVQAMIRGLGQADAEALLEEQGEISVTCEFCNQRYALDAVDLGQLFSAENGVDGPGTQQ